LAPKRPTYQPCRRNTIRSNFGMADVYWLIVPRRKWTFSMPIPDGSDHRHSQNSFQFAARKKLRFPYVYSDISCARAWKIAIYFKFMQASAWKIAQSQLRARLIFEIARLTANFLKFARLGAHFEKNTNFPVWPMTDPKYKPSCVEWPP
jgi:hypothetical protein